MALKLITPPAVEALSLEETKAHLRVESDDEDSLIQIYIRAAREYLEGPNGWLRRALVLQTWDLYIDGFPCDNDIEIPIPPLVSVTSLKYDDASGNEQTMDPSLYYVDSISEPGWVLPVDGTSWPTTLGGANTVRIRFVAGYGSGASPNSLEVDETANIPFNIKAGMLLIIGHLYENREENVVGTIANRIPFGAEYILRPHRVQLGMA